MPSVSNLCKVKDPVKVLNHELDVNRRESPHSYITPRPKPQSEDIVMEASLKEHQKLFQHTTVKNNKKVKKKRGGKWEMGLFISFILSYFCKIRKIVIKTFKCIKYDDFVSFLKCSFMLGGPHRPSLSTTVICVFK